MNTNDLFRDADNWAICPKCLNNFGWNNEDGLVGQMCSCGYIFTLKENTAPVEQICMNCHEYRPDVEDGYCPHCGDKDDDEGCDSFSKKVTEDHKNLAEEMVVCMKSCALTVQEQIHYIANILADVVPNMKKSN